MGANGGINRTARVIRRGQQLRNPFEAIEFALYAVILAIFWIGVLFVAAMLLNFHKRRRRR